MNPAKQLISLRISDATKQKLDELAERYGTQTEAVAVAIDRLHQAEAAEIAASMGEIDRVSQVNYIHQIAATLTSQDWTVEGEYDGDIEAAATDAVGFWMDQSNQAMDLPLWWDDHDTGLLKQRVIDNLTD